MNHNDTNGFSLSSGTPSGGVRRSVYNWYDAADRPEAMADYGSGDATAGAGQWKSTAVPSYDPGTALTWTDATVYNGLALLTRYTYDTAGRQESVISGVRKNGNNTVTTTTKTFYDDLDRRIFVVENHQGTYDPTVSIGTVTSGQNRTTGWVYTGLGQVDTLTAYNSGSPTNQETEYFYENAYHAHLVTKTIYPDGDSTDDNVQMTYNVDGTLATRKDQRGVVMTYTYDNARRLVREGATTLPGTVDGTIKSIARTYDNLGRPEKITSYANANGTGTIENEVQYEYLAIGKLRRLYQSHQGAVNTMSTPHVWLSYVADVDGNDVYTKSLRRLNTNYPVDASAVTQFYYNTDSSVDGRLHRPRYQKLFNATLTSGEATLFYEYNGTGRVARTYAHSGGAVDIERTMATATGVYGAWDRFGRTLQQRWFRGTTTHDQVDYTYDYAGNRLTRDTNGTTTYDQAYTYDGLQRLKSVDEPTATEDRYWKLDQLGNWEQLRNGLDASGTLLENRLTLIDNAINGWTVGPFATPSYDAAGNMTTMPRPYDPTQTFNTKYDAWNRMVSLATFGPTPVTIQTNEYDGLNQRIQKTVGSLTWDYYYNDKWQLLTEALEGEVRAIYAWHPYYIDALAIRFDDSERYVFLHDDNFNVTAAYDVNPSSGTYRQVVERYTYTPYGEVTFLEPDFSVKTTQKSDIGNNHLYTGRERDPETGLYHFRTRFYHAPLGRFTTRDWIRYWGGMNLYGYVGGMPTRFVDPWGFAPIWGPPSTPPGGIPPFDIPPTPPSPPNVELPPGSGVTPPSTPPLWGLPATDPGLIGGFPPGFDPRPPITGLPPQLPPWVTTPTPIPGSGGWPPFKPKPPGRELPETRFCRIHPEDCIDEAWEVVGQTAKCELTTAACAICLIGCISGSPCDCVDCADIGTECAAVLEAQEALKDCLIESQR